MTLGLGAALPSRGLAELVAQSQELSVTMVGNAGVLLTDGATSLLVDLPYTSGASGYMTYDPVGLNPPGDVVSVVTHHHRDHFDPDLFLLRENWLVVGAPTAVERLPEQRVLQGDSVTIGEFIVIGIATPHTSDHRSYRVRWRERSIHFVGDTEDPSHLRNMPMQDLLFITPWLSCAASDSGVTNVARRSVAYHVDPNGRDRICGAVEVLEQGASFTLASGPLVREAPRRR